MKTLLRYKNKRRCLTTRGLTDFADAWEHPTISKRQYKQLAAELFVLIIQQIVNKKIKYVLPFGMGEIYVGQQKRESATQPINWQATRKKGEIVRHLNLKSNNFVFRFVWRRPHFDNNKKYQRMQPGKFIDIYYFKPCREAKRYIFEQVTKTSEDPYLKPYSTPYETL